MILKKAPHKQKIVMAFALTEDHLELIQEVSIKRNLHNQSLTLRQILDEWELLRKEVELTPPTPQDQ